MVKASECKQIADALWTMKGAEMFWHRVRRSQFKDYGKKYFGMIKKRMHLGKVIQLLAQARANMCKLCCCVCELF